MTFGRFVCLVSFLLGAAPACSSAKGGGNGPADGATPVDSSPSSDASGSQDAPAANEGASSDGGAPSDASSPDSTSDATTFDAPFDDGSPEAGAGPWSCVGDAGFPDELRCTGLYADWASRTIAPGVMYFDPAFKLWSDGAAKRRWISAASPVANRHVRHG